MALYAALGVLVVGLLIYAMIPDTPAPAPVVPAAVAPPSEETTKPAETPSVAPSATTPEPTASASASASAEPSAAPTPVATKRPAEIIRTSPWAPVKPTKRSTNCNPPYDFDKQGVKHLKTECL